MKRVGYACNQLSISHACSGFVKKATSVTHVLKRTGGKLWRDSVIKDVSEHGRVIISIELAAFVERLYFAVSNKVTKLCQSQNF